MGCRAWMGRLSRPLATCSALGSCGGCAAGSAAADSISAWIAGVSMIAYAGPGPGRAAEEGGSAGGRAATAAAAAGVHSHCPSGAIEAPPWL